MAIIIDEPIKNDEKFTEIRLGPNKSVFVTPWKAKAKKEFIKIFKKKGENVSEEDILNILLYPYLKEKIYLSPAEAQYVLVKLREISLRNNEVEFSLTCNNCGEDINVNINISDLIQYKETHLPIEKDGKKWEDPESLDQIKNALIKFKQEPPHIIMLGLNLKKYNDKEIKSLEEFLEIYNDLDFEEAEDLEDEWLGLTSDFKIIKNFKCNECNVELNYEFDVIPGFFDPLLPKA